MNSIGSKQVAFYITVRPEFSSYMGTAWATLALVRTLPECKDTAQAPVTRKSD